MARQKKPVHRVQMTVSHTRNIGKQKTAIHEYLDSSF